MEIITACEAMKPLMGEYIHKIIWRYIKMPNMDGTGPDGEGSLTGRGFGKCKGAKPCPRGRRMGRGFGRRQINKE